MSRRAFITGVAGQDGSYLAELLLGKGYRVYGLIRHRTGVSDHPNLVNVLGSPDFELISGDITDRTLMEKSIRTIKPHEVYNLASQSHVGRSFEMPELTAEVTGRAVLGLLEAIRGSGFNSKFYQASTSELFGNASTDVQDESTPLMPVSPYGCAKLFAHHITRVYRDAYNMFACAGILYNHESVRRGEDFVTQKVARAVARIKLQKQQVLKLGNLESRRDWGHARDYVRGMYLMLQAPTPDDFVLATGETHTISEFVDIAFKRVGLRAADYVRVDPTLYRPIDVNVLCGRARKAEAVLKWVPDVTFKELVEEMVDGALAVLR